MSRVTVQALADQLGLSKFAVSRALSGKAGVSDETREAVVELAARLGYRPRPRNPGQSRLSVLYRDAETAHREQWTTVQSGMHAEAERCGADIVVSWSADLGVIRGIAERSGGVLLVGLHDDAVLAGILEAGVPCVRLGAELPPLTPVDHVSGADDEGSAALTQHLADLGHLRFVYVHGKRGYPGRVARLRAAEDVLARYPGAEVREMAFAQDNAADDFRNEITRLWESGFVPTAFLCGNDYVAVTVLTGLMRLGHRVPDDVSVVGYGDYPVASQTSPALSTARVPYRDMGAAAVRLLLSRLGSGPGIGLPPRRLGLVPQLMLRQSTAVPGIDAVQRRDAG